jgi:hypothetical protein
MDQGTLFPLSIRPTMRDVALAVREGGEQGLPGGVRRADEATYQEVKCRSALNHVEGMPFAWTLNPYRGCTHGCHYCFARRYHRQFELNAGDQFASIILVKTNFVEVLARELSRPAWRRELVALGTATDPYQPIEGHYKLTRGAIVELACVEDARQHRHERTDGRARRRRPARGDESRALHGVHQCAECGRGRVETARAWNSAPAAKAPRRADADPGWRESRRAHGPGRAGITTSKRVLESTISAIAAHGAAFVGANVLHLEGGTRDHFFEFLGREYPHLVDGYQRLYANGAKRVPREYAKAVSRRCQSCAKRSG